MKDRDEKFSIQNDDDDDHIFPVLLFATRSGEVIEASFSMEYQGIKKSMADVPSIKASQ